MAFDATATRIVGELYEDTQYLKLLALLCTFRKAMATTKTNVIPKDAKDWQEWIDEHFTPAVWHWFYH